MRHYILLALLFFTGQAIGQDYVIQQFSSDIILTEDGSLNVTERINVNFQKKKRGIIRNIPIKYNFEGKEIILNLTKVSVENHDYKVTEGGNNKVIRIGNPSKYLIGDQSYILKYTASHPIINHDNYQELYWNITGNSWDTNIQSADVTLHVPNPLALSTDDMLIWTGPVGGKGHRANISQKDVKTFMASSSAPLKAGEGMTITLKMPSDFVIIPEGSKIISDTQSENSSDKPYNNKPLWLAFPLAVFACIFGWWKSIRSREIKPTYNNKYEHFPPKGLTSAHVGGYIDHKVNRRDILSLIPYWAAEGFITMTYDDGLYLEKKENIPSSFPQYEQSFFTAIFQSSDRIYIDELKGSLYGAVSKVTKEVEKEITYQDYYDDYYISIWKSSKSFLWFLVPIVLGILSIVFFKVIWLGVGFFVLGIALGILSIQNAPMSPKGKNLMARLEAFKRFIKESPSEEISKLLKENPKYFDQMFPFAVAFGLDNSWLKAVEPFMDSSPDWYHHSSGGRYGYFRDTYNTKDIDRSFTVDPTPPPISSGGGFGGGGSSGGGFGGGGGSSW